MRDNRFKMLGSAVAQVGYYIMSIDESSFQNNEFHRTLTSFVSQFALLLNDILGGNTVKTMEESKTFKYLSKKEVIKAYHPIITLYALNQAINKKEIIYSKRGSKYYFELNDIEKWLSNKKSNQHENNITMKYV